MLSLGFKTLPFGPVRGRRGIQLYRGYRELRSRIPGGGFLQQNQREHVADDGRG
jgi:hypothetical protein